MNTKIPSRDHCKVFHLQPRAFVSVRLRDVVTVTISGTGRTLDSGPRLTLICHPLVSYHQLYSPFQNINLPFNILVTHLLQFRRPHVWQNSLFQHDTYTTLQLTRTMHIRAMFKIYQTDCRREDLGCLGGNRTHRYWKTEELSCEKMNSLRVEPPGRSSREINLSSITWNFVLIIKATLRWNDAFRR